MTEPRNKLCCWCGEDLEYEQGRMVWMSARDGSYGHKWCVEKYDNNINTKEQSHMESEVMDDLMDKLVEKLKGDIKNCETKIEEMKKALQFYADPATYDIRNLSDHGYIIIDKDNGERARQALGGQDQWIKKV